MPKVVRFVATSLVLITLLTGTSWAKKKERVWQTGKLLDTDAVSHYAGSVRDKSVPITIGNRTYGGPSDDFTAVYRDYQTYVIEAGQYVYMCQQRLRGRRSKPVVLTVNGPVQFAIEKDSLYIKDEDGREHETKIVKKILKTD